jgi:FMN phosphatase YigB (HAD superfamily)
VKPRLYSFDIFDTVLTRNFAVPGDLFVGLGEEAARRGLVKLASEEFARKRLATEAAARDTAPAREPCLSEIYAILAPDLGLTPAETGQLLALELEAEEAALQPVPGMRERIAAAREAGGRVIFISDMYLPAAFLERVLTRHGLFRSGDRVYVSGEARASKAAGELYSRIRSELAAAPSEWLHVGDNERADDSVPRKLGITTGPFTATRLSRYEWLARGKGPVAPVWRSRLAAAMRLARLEGAGSAEDRRVIWSTGADVAGPLLFGFVYWSLRQARERGIRRLYFIARDGQVLHRIACQISSAWGFDIECRYLYGSRQAWRIPALNGVGPEEVQWAAPSSHGLSVEHVLARLGLEPEPLRALLAEQGFAPDRWREPLTEAELERLRRVLVRDPVRQLATQAGARTRALLLRYLQQEGVLDEVPFALVDMGWNGNLQRSLSRALQVAGQATAARLTGLYFGLYHTTIVPEGQTMLDYWSQLPEAGHGLMPQTVSMFEMMTAADHGSTIRYEAAGEVVAPCLTAEQNVEVLAWGLKELQSSILAFTTHFLDLARETRPPLAELQYVTRRVFELFYLQPVCEEAQAWGQFPLRGQPIENIRGRVVPELSAAQMLAALLDYRKRPDGWWMEGTLAARPSLWLWLYLRLRRWYACIRRRESRRS